MADLLSSLRARSAEAPLPGLLQMLLGAPSGGGRRLAPAQSSAQTQMSAPAVGAQDDNIVPGLATMAMNKYQPPTGLDPNDHRPISYTGGPSQEIMDNTNFPVDPYSIEFRPGVGETGQGQFELNGKELFGSVLPRDMLPGSTRLSEIPKNLQPLLAPSLVRYYKNADYQGGAARGQMSAPWTRFFAPNSGAESYNTGAIEHTWPGITHYDPWGRSMGEYPNLYS